MSAVETGRNNTKVREEGGNLSRELEGVVQTFNNALEAKEKERTVLVDRIDQLKLISEETLGQLRILSTNLSIYDQNLAKVSAALDQLDSNERMIKERYESLLLGSSNLSDLMPLEPGNLSVQKRVTMDVEEKLMGQYNKNCLGRDHLIKRRREYLESLDNAFKKFDEDLFYIDGVRNNLMGAFAEINAKKEKAKDMKASIEARYNTVTDEKKKLDKELENVIRQENYLINEYREVLRPIGASLEIKPQTDKMLFNMTSEQNESNTFNDQEEVRLKVVN
jgi:CII-binding regulator of phage lambda lysogenization HflD